MKKIILSSFAAALFLVACNGSGEPGDNKKDPGNTTSPSSSETKNDEPWVVVPDSVMMQKMMEYSTPGKMHQMMASWNGTWNGETTMWWFDGDSAHRSKGTAVNTMILGGRYQSSKHTGNMMGMPFEGQATMGYDNETKQFISTWVDVMGTGIMTMKGPWDEAAKTITLTGTSPDVCRPEKDCTMKEVFTIVDNDNHKMEMYGPDPKTGKEYKVMEIKLTRKK